MTALAAEVVWTRLLSLLFGGTTYTFSLILAAFLLGLGIGSSGGAALARGLERPRLAFGLCQALLCGAIAWGGYLLTASLPYWPIDPSLAPTPWLEFHLDLARTILVVLPAAILWGASFPLALAAAATRGDDPARVVGRLYAANTVGRHRRVARRQPHGCLARQPARATDPHRRLRRVRARRAAPVCARGRSKRRTALRAGPGRDCPRRRRRHARARAARARLDGGVRPVGADARVRGVESSTSARATTPRWRSRGWRTAS